MKKALYSIISFLLIFSIFSLNTASAFQISGFELTAKGALLVSLDTGEIIYSKNEHEKMYPASITKLLTAIVVLESAKDLDAEKIVMTTTVRDILYRRQASAIGLQIDEELPVREALAGLLIASGGDVAYCLAEKYGSSVDDFMKKMNDTAKKIGMNDSHFGNPVGLHDEQTYTTPHDVYLLAKYALQFDIIKELTAKARYTLPATNKRKSQILSTTNFLIDPNTNYYYKYASGVKTGFTDQAGRCVVSTASYGGYNYICIIMGCENKDGKRHEFLESANLYRWAFNNFEYKSILDINAPVGEIPVELSMNTDFLKLYPKESLKKILPKKADESTVSLKVRLNSESVDAPIKSGQILGSADVIYAGEVIGNVDLVSHENVKANIFLQTGRIVKNAVNSTVFKIIIGVIIAFVAIYISIFIYLNVKSRKRRRVKYMPYNKHDKDR